MPIECLHAAQQFLIIPAIDEYLGIVFHRLSQHRQWSGVEFLFLLPGQLFGRQFGFRFIERPVWYANDKHYYEAHIEVRQTFTFRNFAALFASIHIEEYNSLTCCTVWLMRTWMNEEKSKQCFGVNDGSVSQTTAAIICFDTLHWNNKFVRGPACVIHRITLVAPLRLCPSGGGRSQRSALHTRGQLQPTTAILAECERIELSLSDIVRITGWSAFVY